MTKKLKITVTPEGRPNVWIPEKESLKKYIRQICGKHIHNFTSGGGMVIGADHSKASVLEDVDRAEHSAVFTDKSNMGHSLALIIDNKLQCFDIGKLSEDDLIIQESK